MEVFDKGIVADAVSSALRLRAPSFDAVKQLILRRIERRPALKQRSDSANFVHGSI